MKIKKILGIALATTMVFGASLTAFAEDDNTVPVTTDNKGVYSTQTTGSGTVETPIIKVVVPKTTDVVLNPYGITINKDEVKQDVGLKSAEAQVIASKVENIKTQIVAPEYYIYNLSNVPMKVTPTFTVKATGVTLMDAAPAENDTKNATTKWATITATFGETGVILGHTYAGKTEDDKQPAFSMAAGTFNEDKECTAATNVKLTFTGSLNGPDKVATSWTDDEKLDITIKYVFAPQVIQ